MSLAIETVFQQAVMFAQSGRLPEAKQLFQKLLKELPNHPQLLTNLGRIDFQLGNLSSAVKFLQKSVQIDRNQPQAFLVLGNGFFQLKDYQKAIIAFKNAISLSPKDTDAYFGLGIVLHQIKKNEEALSAYDQAISLRPFFAKAFNNRANVLKDLHRYDEAIESLKRAIQIDPEFVDAYYNLGNTQQILRRFESAVSSYDRAIALKADDADSYHNRANALSALGLYGDAIASLERSLQIQPDLIKAYFSKANIYSTVLDYENAIKNYEHVLAFDPNFDFLLGDLIHTKMMLCDWNNLDHLISLLIKKAKKLEKVTAPFPILAVTNSLSLHKKVAEVYSRKLLVEDTKFISPKKEINNKIRIGYFSADFHNHATMHLMADIFKYHDKNKFEVIAFSFGPDKKDEWRARVLPHFDEFIDLRNTSDNEIVECARRKNIDIAIDLKGFTEDGRPEIFRQRVAPIQLSYLGFPGTMGSEFIDYIIADSVLIPAEYQKYYSEKVAYLPNCYQANLDERKISERLFTREELGLPSSGFVFCCFNNSYKITPEMFECWMSILRSTENSVLWLFCNNDLAINHLKTEADNYGVDSDRLIFAKSMPVEEHLSRIRLADLFLDTFPYNAHTTASDAIRVGLPVLTLMGESFASRVAASLLTCVDLPELITASMQTYRELAIELASNTERFKKIKDKLKLSLSKTDLFDAKRFTVDLEMLYKLMVEQHENAVESDHIYLSNTLVALTYEC